MTEFSLIFLLLLSLGLLVLVALSLGPARDLYRGDEPRPARWGQRRTR